MTGLLGIVAFSAFGIVATIAERAPQCENKKLTRNQKNSRSRV
jgi:hypothetical protein